MRPTAYTKCAAINGPLQSRCKQRADQTKQQASRATGGQTISRVSVSKELGTASTAGEKFARLEETLGHRFARPALLELALTHRSARQREVDAPTGDNERLEFFGDRVLGLVVSEYLLQTYPEWDAGKLSKAHSRLVSGVAVRSAAQALGLGQYLRLGRGEEMTGGREKQSLLANAYEAVVAAIYLDAGIGGGAGFSCVTRCSIRPFCNPISRCIFPITNRRCRNGCSSMRAGAWNIAWSAKAGRTIANYSKWRRG